MKATVLKEMYNPNDTVEYFGQLGRVVCYDTISYTIHVMFRNNANTWIVKKCDPFHCKQVQAFLWTVETAFSSRYLRKDRTPDLRPIESNDYVMEL